MDDGAAKQLELTPDYAQKVVVQAKANELTRKAEALQRKAQALAPAKIIQLPFWPEPARGVPNVTLRGALFAAIQGKNRKVLKRDLLATQKGIEVRFTGFQLDQSDLDVWEQALHLARQNPLGNRCTFTAHAFLRALARPTGRAQHEWLKDVFARLSGCSVEVTVNGQTYFGSLIEGGTRDERSGLYALRLNPDIIKLYTASWTGIDWEQRQQLRRKPLAQWLHGFYATHANAHPMKVQTLWKLSGSQEKRLRNFRAKLRTALDQVRAVDGIRSWRIDDADLVHVERVPTPTQQRHLENKRPR